MITVSGRPVRVGAIGAGWWATTNHFPILAARPDVELVSVCRPDSDLLRTVKDTFGFTHATEDVDELLEQNLDAVVVATPHHLHYEHARLALERGLHVMCEKPMTLHAHEAWHLADLARARDLVLLVPHGWQYTDYVVSAKELLDEGAVGEVEFISCTMASPTKEFFAGGGGPPSQWTPNLVAPDMRTWQDPGRGGGYAHGQLTHGVNLVLWLTGLRAARVSGVVSNPHSAVDLYNSANVTFTNGAAGSFSGAATLPADDKFQVDIRLFGSRGVLLLDVERERAEFRMHNGRHQSLLTSLGSGDYECTRPVNRFIGLITGTESVNNSSGEVAACSVELIEAMVRSASQNGVPVDICRRDREHVTSFGSPPRVRRP